MKYKDNLKTIYGSSYKEEYYDKLNEIIKESVKEKKVDTLSQENVYLITYGDIISTEEEKPLKTLHKFLKKNYNNVISDVHILPMFPYTSDDGFSVVDYEQVDPKLGTWEDLKIMSKDFRLMYDFVVNHMSKSSKWFEGYLNDDPKYKTYFIPEDKTFDYSKVVRPRTSPLISHYKNNKTAWTTFSEDQVDLNFKEINVLLEMTRILIKYVNNGATSIRLDAIGFLYKQSGTTCIHLPQTHAVIKLWREIMDEYYPHVQLITETNVPHIENISYYGNNSDEANQVYQFALPTLTLHTFISRDVTKLVEWAKTIGYVGESATYFNFLASHDGIGMRPSEGILTDLEREVIFDHVKANGALFNYKNNTDGTQSIYEININYFDALKLNSEYDIDRFIGAHSLLLTLQGVPAIYYHSLLGSISDREGALSSKINRRINREKFDLQYIEKDLSQNNRRKEISERLSHLITLRSKYDAFDPYTPHKIEQINESVLKIIREGKTSQVECYLNVSDKTYKIDTNEINIITNKETNNQINPYEMIWIVK